MFSGHVSRSERTQLIRISVSATGFSCYAQEDVLIPPDRSRREQPGNICQQEHKTMGLCMSEPVCYEYVDPHSQIFSQIAIGALMVVK